MAQEEGSFQPDGRAHSSNDGAEASPFADEMTLHEQVMDIIESILADAEPRSEGTRTRLRELVGARPDDPAGALLVHLLETQKAPAFGTKMPAQLESPDAVRTVTVPVSPELREGIQSILADNLLLTAFQPVHALPTGEVISVEALTRFVGEDGAGADVWFSEAAAAGLGTELEIAALRCALTAAHDVPEDLSVAFNLTPGTAGDPRVRNLLAAASLAPDRVIIEFTGSLEGADGHYGSDGLGPLRALGLRLALSASGAASVSLDRIEKLRPDIIKLDRHLIEGIENDEGQKIRARAVVELAREMGADVIAEGIETAGELEQVKVLEVSAAQGYLLGRPSVHPLDWSAWRTGAQAAAQPAS
jgi:EAL domain-containing protein (putative c-di-GMP-specific phosphodiesterase class I)